MSHLIKFRKGWQSEHLAKYILSKFSFIAEPINISDDLGSDFFCTIFEIEKKGFLLPQSSFAIQIKSNKQEVDITNKLSYLENLEIPFFAGVVDRKLQKLTIYSGESIPHFFSLYGNPSNQNRTFIKLNDKIGDDKFVSIIGSNYYLNFPKILEIDSEFDYEKNKNFITPIIKLITLIQKNLSAKKSQEYVFDISDSDNVIIYSGSGSAKVYMKNLYKRIAEAFLNVLWIAQNENDMRKAEFIIYEETLNKLSNQFGELPPFLTNAYKKASDYFNKE